MTDREKAIRILEGNYKNFVLRHNGELLTVNELIALLKAQEPTAPVVHAKWEMDYSWHGHCRCSNCHGTSIEAEWLNRYMWPYCPNCGAQMNRGEDNEID